MIFHSSYTALLTPFKDKKVDYDGYRKLIDFQIENGTHGLVPVGTTGESPTLSHDEHKKLVEVCKMRDTPIIVFINKLDRYGKDAFDLLDEVEQKLGINVHPLSWPIGQGDDFQGVYNIYQKGLNLFSSENKQHVSDVVSVNDIESSELDDIVGSDAAGTLREELELIETVYPEYTNEKYLEGKVSPVFFDYLFLPGISLRIWLAASGILLPGPKIACTPASYRA